MSADGFPPASPGPGAIFWLRAAPQRRRLITAAFAGALQPAFEHRARPHLAGMFITCWPTPRTDRRGFPVYRVLAGASSHG